MRHSRVLNEPVMDEVKSSVANDGSDCEPKAFLEAECSSHHKRTRHHDLYNKRPAGSPHHGEQHIV